MVELNFFGAILKNDCVTIQPNRFVTYDNPVMFFLII